jgi:hypothetical protein
MVVKSVVLMVAKMASDLVAMKVA